MNQIKTLVLMQLRDKLDLSWMKSAKENIHVVVTSIIKVVLLTIIYTGVLYGASLLGIVYHTDMPKIMTLVITLVMFMLCVSCTINLTNALYFAEDNRVLITLPVSNNKIFISKLLVFFFYELKRSFTFTIPIILGCAINIYLKGGLTIWSFFWMILPTLIMVALPVLVGALLSIPAMYLYRLINKSNILKGLLIMGALGIYIYLFLSITKFLPTNINLINEWPNMRLHIVQFLNNFEVYNPVGAFFTRTLIGEVTASGLYSVSLQTFLNFLILVVVCVVLYLLCYIISRPLFFKMMSKNFEFNKDSISKHKNKKHSPFISFNLKELRISIRSFEISINYLITYTTIPLLILILNQLFIAMDKSRFGTYISYAFNILLIVLPLLLANTMVATLYSKEGRAGYIKKTKPCNPLVPLLSKLSFHIVACIPSIISSVVLFSEYVNICAREKPEIYAPMGVLNTILLILAILLLDYAHLFYSARLDIMNPKNEEYATSGSDISNENENKSGVVGALIALLYSAFAFMLFSENVLMSSKITSIVLQLLLISAVLFIYFTRSYVLNIKAFYAESKE